MIARIPVLMAALVAISLSQPAAAESAASPYVGQQARGIKTLSAEDVAALRNGDGMGMAKAAELNHYPGPRHVLALARELRLSESQTAQMTAIRDRMSAAVRPLGAELIERERALDLLFGRGEITPERLTAATAAIGETQARLRAAHLAAHLETRAVLGAEQIADYDKLRGYADAGAAMRGHGAGHHH